MLRLRAIFTAAALTCVACACAQAQTWPNRPVKIIAPFAAGGAADTLGRIIAERAVDLPRPRKLDTTYEPYSVALVQELSEHISAARSTAT